MLVVMLVASSAAVAQNGINTPYSRYGFGILSERSTGFNKAMGGVSMGYRDGVQVNITNPASYAAVDSLSAIFDFGMTFQNGNFSMGDLKQNARNTSFDYFAFQFRARKGLGITVGVLPLSRINYSFESSPTVLEGSEDVTSSYSYTGTGGLRQLFLGAGWNPIKPLSIGFNVGYIWGDYTHVMTMAYNDANAFSLARTYYASLSTFSLDFGAQGEIPLNKTDKIVVGATYTLGHKVNDDAFRTTSMLNSAVVESSTTDTIANAFEMPHGFAVGLTYYHSNTITVGADFELQKWNSVRFPNQDGVQTDASGMVVDDAFTTAKGTLNDRMRISLGASWTPNPLSRSYAKRITYKIGGYYSKMYANAASPDFVSGKPTEFGLSAGVSLPIQNRNIWHNQPRINLSFQWAHTSVPYMSNLTSAAKTLTENYLRLCIGLTFNERWFYQWKVQ